jgi:hypothetical protein
MKSVGLLVTAIAVTLGYTQSPDTLWARTYGGPYDDYGNSVAQTTDGGYIITGYTTFYAGGPNDVWLIKTDTSGDTLWTKTYGGADSDCGLSGVQTTDGGYVVTGGTVSYGAGNTDVWLIKTDASGDTIWTRTYGNSDYDYGYSVAQTTDGGYVVAGYTSSYGGATEDVWLIRTDASGDTIWTRSYGGTEFDCGYSVVQTTDCGYIVIGITGSYGAGWIDVWVIKTEPDVTVEENGPSVVTKNGVAATIFRGPLQLPEGKKCKVYDITGRVVESTRIRPGIYFIEVDGVVTQKVVKVR